MLMTAKISSCLVNNSAYVLPQTGKTDSRSLSLITSLSFTPTTLAFAIFPRRLANMHTFLALLTTLLAAEGYAANSITRRDDSSIVWNTTSCATSDLQIIKEWRNLTSAEKSAYIAAEKCLWELPANTTFDGVVNRHDDLTAVHQYLTPVIHAVVSPPIASLITSSPTGTAHTITRVNFYHGTGSS